MASPMKFGSMHGILLAHRGTRIKLLDHVDVDMQLVSDAEGVVVDVVAHLLDEPQEDRAYFTTTARTSLCSSTCPKAPRFAWTNSPPPAFRRITWPTS